MIAWAAGWQPLTDEKRRLYLERELAWELADNPRHVLAARRFVAVGWLGGYDDLVLRLGDRDEYAWVHLAWSRENQPEWPHCELLGGADDLNRFIAGWDAAGDDDP